MTMLGSVLRALYLVFAVAAGGRSLVQWAADPGRAPLAYALSTVAFGCYASGYLLVRRGTPGPSGRAALAVLAATEISGLVVVGTLSLLEPSLFPDSTIWSAYGAGYGFVPVLIPLLVLTWLRRAPGARGADPALAPSAPLPRPERQGSGR